MINPQSELVQNGTTAGGGFLLFAVGWAADVHWVQVIGCLVGLGGLVLGGLRLLLDYKVAKGNLRHYKDQA